MNFWHAELISSFKLYGARAYQLIMAKCFSESLFVQASLFGGNLT